jgi:hypothetical protein
MNFLVAGINMTRKLITLISSNDSIAVNNEILRIKDIDTIRIHDDGHITFEKQVTVKESQNGEWKLAEPVG